MRTEVRTKQCLFRERLIGIEKGCRLTGIEDLRILRASHIKPWAHSTHSERVDGENGRLLAPHADMLFGREWISFSPSGRPPISNYLPKYIRARLGLNLDASPRYVNFSSKQLNFLEFHRDVNFKKRVPVYFSK